MVIARAFFPLPPQPPSLANKMHTHSIMVARGDLGVEIPVCRRVLY